MGIYSYKAMDNAGKILTGRTSAANEDDLASKLNQTGLEIISCSPYVAGKYQIFRKVTIKELIMICVQIHQLDKAGVSMLDIISEMRDNSTSSITRSVMMDIYDSLKQGKMLSVAFAEHPAVFDTLFVGLIAAGEKTGSFGDAFEHLENHLKWVLKFRTKLKNATYYPIFMLFLLLAVSITMMTFVVPKLSDLLTAQNIPLPFYTKALMALSQWILNYGLVAVIILLLISVCIRILYSKSSVSRYVIDGFILKLPFFGSVITKIEMARFCRFFTITYKSGIGMMECLYTASNVVQNSVIRRSIDDIATSVNDGKQIVEAMKASSAFPSIVVRMFRVGETSGNMDGALKSVNDFYDQEVDESINAFISILQPALTAFMGLILLWITISVFGPIYLNFGGVNK